jgi:hypothetical protein
MKNRIERKKKMGEGPIWVWHMEESFVVAAVCQGTGIMQGRFTGYLLYELRTQ